MESINNLAVRDRPKKPNCVLNLKFASQLLEISSLWPVSYKCGPLSISLKREIRSQPLIEYLPLYKVLSGL